jgi:hypothetical protein|nr:MAG TPA: hypothetical protein [Caudoviricetes sp.]
MKKTEKIIVLRDKKDGAYLKNYKSNDNTMACTSKWTNEIREAAYMPVEFFYSDEERNNKLADFFGAEPLLVEVEYTIKKLDGSEPEDLADRTEKSKRESFKKFLDMLANGLEDD